MFNQRWPFNQGKNRSMQTQLSHANTGSLLGDIADAYNIMGMYSLRLAVRQSSELESDSN